MLKPTDLYVYHFIAHEYIDDEWIELGDDIFIDLESAKRAPLHRFNEPVLIWNQTDATTWEIHQDTFRFVIWRRPVLVSTDKDDIPF